MSTGIKPIETRYAGCRFRSRLEARWAVFFDHAGIPWEYELQGFDLTWRLSLAPGALRYLPDFWLPQAQVWVEVKGELDEGQTNRLLNAAASLSSNNGGGCHDSGGHDLVVLGNVPKPGVVPTWSPPRLHMHKGDLLLAPFLSNETPCGGIPVARDVGGSFPEFTTEVDIHPDCLVDTLLQGMEVNYLHHSNNVVPAALHAARTARFEHGERG